MNAPSLTEEIELFEKYEQNHDPCVRDKIVEKYVYIAEIVAKRFIKSNRKYQNGIDYEDLYQVACLGLIYAVDRYTPDKGARFATYATSTIIGEVRKYFRDKGYVMRVPQRLYEIFRKAERVKRTEGTSDLQEMARILGVSEEDVYEAYKSGDAAFVQSIEGELFGGDGNLALADTIGRDDKGFLVIENSDFIGYCRKKLNEKELEFIDLRYYEEKSQREIGEIMDMSQMQTSRFERQILKKLRLIYFGD